MNWLRGLEFLLPGTLDVIQILIVGVGLYYVLRLLARTRAIQMLVGLLVLGALYYVARILGMGLIESIMTNLFQYGTIAALIVFQPELRNALARLGQNRMVTWWGPHEQRKREVVEELAEAVERLSRAKIGAILAVQREMGLEEYVETGSAQEARVSADLIVSFFSPYGPLHDGAVLVREDTIIGAGVILPLTQYPVADRTLGTRHRAALGLSEESDALVIVVSEETSQISLARGGALERDVNMDRVRAALAGRDRKPALQP